MSVIICPFNAFGHVIPTIVLAKKLASHGLKVIYIFPGSGLYARISKGRDVFPGHLDIVSEVIDFGDGQDDLWPTLASGIRKVEVQFSSMQSFYARLPMIRSKIEELKSSTPISALIVDYVLLWEGILVKDINLSVYTYWPSSTASILSYTHIVTKSPVDMNGYVKLPNTIPSLPILYPRDFDRGLTHQSLPVYNVFKEWNKWFQSCCQGMILNTFETVEPDPLSELRNMLTKPVYAVGPLSDDRNANNEDENCIQWLDKLPQRSVVFLCFGSWLELSESQLQEIALGIEKSSQRFLWVMLEKAKDFVWLKEFEARTNEQGMIIKGWAPQQKILSHASIGSFINVCGWNSVVESIVLSGVPLIAWPLYLDQLINCRYLVDGLEIAMEVADEDGFVTKDEVCRAVSLVMSNGIIQHRALALKEVAAHTISKGGSSYKSLESLIDLIGNKS